MVGNVNSFTTVCSDLIPSQAFHQVKDVTLSDQIVDKIPLPNGEGVLVLKANHIIDRCSLVRLTRAGDKPGIYFMKADSEDRGDGLFVVWPGALVPVLFTLWCPERYDLQVPGDIKHISGIPDLPYALGKGAEQTRNSEDRLIAALPSQTEDYDGFLARNFDRRISRFISKRLVHMRITPNQITLTGMTIGLIGAFFLSLPGYWVQLMGALLFLFCVIMDGVDGEIARLKLKETRFGHYLDVVTDNIVHLAIFVGIAFGLYHDTGNEIYLYALWFMLGGFGLCLVAVYQCILRRSTDELERSPRVVRMMALMTNRDFAYLVAALAVVHRLNWFLMGAAVGSYLFAFSLWVMTIYEKRARSKL
jgi:phosphatidylglycerophosphate synthase